MAGLPNYELGSSEAIPDTREKPDVKARKRRNQYGVVLDYIPDPNRPARKPKRDRAVQARSAYEQSIRRQAANRETSLDLAKTKLATMNAATAVEFIEKQPDRVRELYLVAEEQGQARRSVLSRFPRAGKVARGEPTSAENDLMLAEHKARRAEARAKRTREISPAVPELPVADQAQLEGEEPQPEGEADGIQA